MRCITTSGSAPLNRLARHGTAEPFVECPRPDDQRISVRLEKGRRGMAEPHVVAIRTSIRTPESATLEFLVP
jgi:hypothetical protein